jgi:hypothetical protein
LKRIVAEQALEISFDEGPAAGKLLTRLGAEQRWRIWCASTRCRTGSRAGAVEQHRSSQRYDPVPFLTDPHLGVQAVVRAACSRPARRRSRRHHSDCAVADAASISTKRRLARPDLSQHRGTHKNGDGDREQFKLVRPHARVRTTSGLIDCQEVTTDQALGGQCERVFCGPAADTAHTERVTGRPHISRERRGL